MKTTIAADVSPTGTRHGTYVACLAWSLTIFFGESSVWSDTFTWSGSSTGPSWNDGANWGGNVPGSGDIALFSSPAYNSQPALISSAVIGGIWDTGGPITISGSSDLIIYGTTIKSNSGTGIQIGPNAGSLTISAPLVLQNDQSWINNSVSPLTVTGNISGPGSLTTLGSGVQTLTGANTIGGSLTVDGGTLQLPGGSLSTAGGYEAVGNSGIGVFTQTGGTNTIATALYLGNNAGSVGTYNLFGGLLVVPSVPQGSGSGMLNLAGGILSAGTSTNGTGGATVSLPIALASTGNSAVFNAAYSSLTLAGPISGPGGVTKTGAAMLVLAGSNTYTGQTTITQGGLLLANPNAAQNTTVNVGGEGSLLFSGGIGSFNVGSIGGSGNLVLNDMSGKPIALVTGGNNANTIYSGVISGQGALVHNGSGTLLLAGPNTYTGGTFLGPDVLVFGNSASAGAGSVTFVGDATVSVTASMTIPNSFVADGNTTGTVDTASYAVTLSGSISGPGNLNKAGAGTLILSNTNVYSGGTSISQGTLQLASAAAVQNSTVSVNSNNGLQFSPGIGMFNVGGLSGSNSLTLSDTGGGAATLAVGGNNADTTYSGAIGGNGVLMKEGTGMLTLIGTNSFTGGMYIDPGTVAINSDAALGALPSSPSTNITFAADSTLQALGSFALSASRNILIAPGAAATFDTNGNTLAICGLISGPGGTLTEIGNGVLILGGTDNTYSGGTVVADGTLVLASSNSVLAGSSLLVGSGADMLFGSASVAAASLASDAASSRPAAVPVPEPSTFVLLAAVLGVWWAYRAPHCH